MPGLYTGADGLWGGTQGLQLGTALSTPPGLIADVGGGGIVTAGLFLELDAGNAASYPGTGLTWFDLTANNYDASLSAGSTPAWVNSNDGYFDFSAGNFMTLPSALPLQGVSQFTWNAWVWFANVATPGNPGKGALFTFGQNFANDILFGMYRGDTFFQINNAGDGSASLGGNPGLGTWLNICLVYDGAGATNADRMKCFVAAVQQSLSFSYTVPAVTASLGTVTPEIGRYALSQGDPDLQFVGRLAYFSFYDRALLPAEILQNYNALVGRFP